MSSDNGTNVPLIPKTQHLGQAKPDGASCYSVPKQHIILGLYPRPHPTALNSMRNQCAWIVHYLVQSFVTVITCYHRTENLLILFRIYSATLNVVLDKNSQLVFLSFQTFATHSRGTFFIFVPPVDCPNESVAACLWGKKRRNIIPILFSLCGAKGKRRNEKMNGKLKRSALLT